LIFSIFNSYLVFHTVKGFSTVDIDNEGDFSNSDMKLEFNVGDYGNDNAIFHLWTRPGGSSSNHWYQKANFALYARLHYLL